jgi:iron(III) transport system substrate-binding protein
MRSRQRRLHVLGPVLAAGLAVSLAACGSSASGSSTSSSSDSKFDSMSTSDLAAQAKKEGSLTWYTTFADDDVKPMLDAFNKDYPGITVNAVRLSADKIPPRLLTEQKGGKFNADVVSGDSPQIAQVLQAGGLQPYTPKDISALPKGLSLPKGYEGVVYVVTTVLAYNPTVVKQKGITAPTSWDDLTKPEWKGQFSIDPGAVNWYDSLIKAMGHDKALKLVQGLGNNQPVFVESHTQALTQVQAGEPMGAATAYGYKASSLKGDSPDQVEFVNDKPLPSSLNLIDVVKKAPHPAAARLFVDWMVSQAGQKAVVDITNHTSIRTDVTNDPAVWDETQWPPAWGDPVLTSDTYNKELSEFKEALHAP